VAVAGSSGGGATGGGVEMVPVPLDVVGPHLSPALREGIEISESSVVSSTLV